MLNYWRVTRSLERDILVAAGLLSLEYESSFESVI